LVAPDLQPEVLPTLALEVVASVALSWEASGG
jgi:hypothetical protein